MTDPWKEDDGSWKCECGFRTTNESDWLAHHSRRMGPLDFECPDEICDRCSHQMGSHYIDGTCINVFRGIRNVRKTD